MKLSLQFMDFRVTLNVSWQRPTKMWDAVKKRKARKPKEVQETLEVDAQPTANDAPVQGHKAEQVLDLPGLGKFAVIAAQEDVNV
jgi:hypothetical protein